MKRFLAVAAALALGLLAVRSRLKHAAPDAASGALPPIDSAKPGASANAPAVAGDMFSVRAAQGAPEDARAGQRDGAAAAHGDAQPPSPASAAQLALLEQVLAARNDNDPRLDTAFNNLSPQAKELFRDKYRRLPAEARNERGTIVYLLSLNLKTAADWAFLREVIAEPPCLSLADCSVPLEGEGDNHFSPSTEVTLAYPAVMALRRAQALLKEGDASAVFEAPALLQAAKASQVRVVARTAAEIESDLGH